MRRSALVISEVSYRVSLGFTNRNLGLDFALIRGDPVNLPDSYAVKTHRLLEGSLAHFRSQELQHQHLIRYGLYCFFNAAIQP